MSGFDAIHYGDMLTQDNKQEQVERQKKRNILITKKDAYDTISPALTKVIQEVLGIDGVEAKVYEQYELEKGLTDAQWLQASRTILGDSPLDEIYDCENFSYDQRIAAESPTLRITTVDGQYNAREDAVKQCFMQFGGFDQDTPLRCSRIIAFDGDISAEKLKIIENYLVNPLEERTLDISNNNLERNIITPDDVQDVQGFVSDHGENKTAYFEDTIKVYKLSMSVEDMDCIYDYFKNTERRDPTIAELRIIDTYRSDHCRHTTFNTEIQNVSFDKEGGIFDHIKKSHESYLAAKKELGRDDRPITLMELAQMSMKYQKAHPELYPNIVNLEISEENNAYTFKTMVKREDGTSEEWLISFKNETHNHPTEIAPFGGAATCLGGCIRDPLSARSWVFQAMRVTGSADPTQPVSEKMANKLSQRVISQLAALGFASYGNQIGLASGQVQEYFHPGFAAKRFEVGYVIAGAPSKNIVKKEPKAGDKIILIGGKTGRDGIGAAAGSSKVHDAKSVTELGAEVQRGNPVEERKLTRLFLDPRFAKLVKRCNDGGAGGISVMIGELSRGLEIDLDKAPLKYAGLDGTEIALSESQERMSIVIDPEDYDTAMELIRLYNLEGTLLGEVNNDEECQESDFLTMKRRGKEIVNISRDFLDQAGAKRVMPEIQITGKEKINFFDTIPHEVQKEKDPVAKFLANLRRKEVASQKGLQAGFDSSVGASNVLAPYGGQYQNTPQVGMISKVPVFDNGPDAVTTTISTHGYNPDLAQESPYIQAIYAVIISLSKQVALGGDYKTAWNSLQEYFGKLGKDPARRGDTYSALLGAWEICKRFAPSIGGKDSMSGTYIADGNRIDVPPTVVSFAANTGHIYKVVSGEFKEAHSCAVCFEVPKDANGMPDLDAYQAQLDKIQELIASGEVKAAHVVEEGGVAATITKMCAGNRMGFSFDQDISKEDYIYKPLLGSIILELTSEPGNIPNTRIIGEVLQPNDDIYITNKSVSLSTVIENRQAPLGEVFPFSKGGKDMEALDVPKKAEMRHGLAGNTMMHINNFIGDALSINILKTAPTLLIPVFPGTNSEIDTARAALKKGFRVQQFIFRNQTQQELMESVKAFAQAVKKAHMIAFPGGFSAGDEPDGSAKFMASICRMAFARDALDNHFTNNSKLTAGICNGFQALIKLGVFDDDIIKDYLGEKNLTLTHNTNHRHITDHVGLQITSVISPMLNFTDIGKILIVPVSHGEGRVVGAEETIRRYIKEGQIFAQYVDANFTPTNEYNGSMFGIAGMTNKKGTILGMMPHPERTDNKLFQNIPGDHNFDIFGSAAKAFGVNSYKNIMSNTMHYMEISAGSGFRPIVGK